MTPIYDPDADYKRVDVIKLANVVPISDDDFFTGLSVHILWSDYLFNIKRLKKSVTYNDGL